MTKRSNHMPVLTTMEMKNIYAMLVRNLRDHRVVRGMARLHVTSTQYDQPMGPKARFQQKAKASPMIGRVPGMLGAMKIQRVACASADVHDATGLAVAWFAVHSARAEPVAWVTAQLYLPCALFEMLALLAYLRAILPAGPHVAASGWPARTH